MPRGDRTGPIGSGPRTGRGLGYCSGFQQPGFMHPGGGYGYGHGRGGGRGYGWRRWANRGNWPGWQAYGAGSGWWDMPPTPQNQTDLLKQHAEQLQAELDAVQQRLSELEE